ncbi:DUF262 domain-containing protein [Clostridium beijerinckii]|uniref:DUF262 domain-containing protein n=1 Tax=Clostridium beijerinckii TaxID=1520 RepID=A0AAW3W4U1_CLOBE|nr:DUF262 domain-containing protein [Clostridium beijerinckii]MBC2456605.1 DUF262 domain-containing protein [Clostridium beijerinckii]MBC2473919.1 DUF262 domain-containing protein [Clostridium beijerinckii]NOV63283.1 uncharacterized protein with ParB-like and HNH nuclease domain [Clostridium beijerinckii]NOV69754.1 uncharacterized protein with ParB-like and HNH nuclease domain [Clostridium beijerinckii]NOW31339.1 uncharacterized protein with ParB-like and HNH nuclease domain [Clostridium beije
MSYHDMTIKDIVGKISTNEVYLPAIQRRFVWGYEQIEKLFDSIMLGYPIGTFLFWKVEKSQANDYTFYKFIQEYHQRDNYLNELAPKPEMKDWIIGVLDGQQRLSSMYLALQGSYSYKKPRARWDNDDAFPKRLFYFNLLRDEFDEDEGITYEFKFLTDSEAEYIDEKHFWIPVKEALKWKEATDYIAYATRKNYLSNSIFIKNLTLLWQRIIQDKIINYFEVEAKELDSILDIFTRVNSGGTVLSKSDLLFSTIVANWEKAREEIEELLKNINNKGEKFNFDNDFIMRLCLVLTDCPVLFNVKNFKKENIQIIRNNWDGIKDAIKRTVDLLVEFGFSQENLTSRNSIIPIAYHIFKGGCLSNDDKKNFKIYLITSLLKQTYGGKGDQVLDSIRNALREEIDGNYVIKNENFTIDILINHKLPADKTLTFTKEDIEELFEYKKSPYTFMVLSILYPHLKLGQVKFHQDHLHPISAFTNTNLKKSGIDISKLKKWYEDKDKLANLQLLEGIENESKNKTPLKDWIENKIDNKPLYKTTNYIPNLDLSLNNFELFIEERKKLMINELVKFLRVK